MLDPRVEKMAQVLVRYSASVKPGDLVSIKGTTLAEPLVLALLEETLKAGGHPRIRLSPTGSPEILYKNASDEQLKFISELDRQEVEQLDVSIRVIASANTRALSNIDPARPAMLSQARKDLSQRFLQRAADGELRWTLTAYPTLAYAQEAEMSLSEYEDFVYRACLLHHKDPVTAWKKLAEQQQRVADYLDKCKELRIRATDTDIRFGIEGRKWINCLGDKNFPDGEVFTGPLEDSVEGHIRYSFPAIREGRHVDDIRLTFKAGKAVEATAVKNQDFLITMLDQDEGARFLGELSLGTNYEVQKFTRNLLFDEKIGGTCHLALGKGYPETGSKNTSGLHWDMVCDLRDGGEVFADGKLIQKNGRFVDPTWPQPS